jgi:hypothetical protein
MYPPALIVFNNMVYPPLLLYFESSENFSTIAKIKFLDRGISRPPCSRFITQKPALWLPTAKVNTKDA